MHTSAAHAGASERKSTVIAQIRHISGGGGVPKSKIERKVRSEYGRGTKGRARRCTRGKKDERRRTNRGIDFNGKRSREVFGGARQVGIRAELKAEKKRAADTLLYASAEGRSTVEEESRGMDRDRGNARRSQ